MCADSDTFGQHWAAVWFYCHRAAIWFHRMISPYDSTAITIRRSQSLSLYRIRWSPSDTRLVSCSWIPFRGLQSTYRDSLNNYDDRNGLPIFGRSRREHSRCFSTQSALANTVDAFSTQSALMITVDAGVYALHGWYFESSAKFRSPNIGSEGKY